MFIYKMHFFNHKNCQICLALQLLCVKIYHHEVILTSAMRLGIVTYCLLLNLADSPSVQNAIECRYILTPLYESEQLIFLNFIFNFAISYIYVMSQSIFLFILSLILLQGTLTMPLEENIKKTKQKLERDEKLGKHFRN